MIFLGCLFERERENEYLKKSRCAISNAVNGQSETVYSKGLTKQTLDQMHQLQAEMQDAVLSVARRILSGEAEKTPSEKACAFCPVRADCNRAYHR